MNTFGITIAIVLLIENIKLFFFKLLVFCQISRVYVACANLYCNVVELTPEVLLFAEPWEILFLHTQNEPETSIVQQGSSPLWSPISPSLDLYYKPTFRSMTLCQVLSEGGNDK